ncbi:MAG: FAD-dependent oxidoreductase [Pseudomonadota bacterium]
MPRDPRYDILFEPIQIGPVTARNRFYQVPHCNGMGQTYPETLAEMRGIKAEGGWAVVCTEETEVDVGSDSTPWNGGRFWDDSDLPNFQRMVEKVHEHGSLAGIETSHAGMGPANRYSREIPIGPTGRPVDAMDPVQARAMDRDDIREVRRLYREGMKRAKRAGFDLVYVYAGHDLGLISHFLSRRRNDRTDEYGGSLENRSRLLREILDDAKETVGDTCAIAIRLAVDELLGTDGITSEGEGRDLVEMLAELPDLWDVNISDWDNDSQTSRFAKEGFQEPYISFVKKVTSKPVVAVGRYTSPDTMVARIKSGVMDFIGAARPSIADPFLPKKIEEGRPDDIRECIGCNICVSGDMLSAPMRCTQNPTMGEEWRRGWHPERIAPKASDSQILIVGAGPSGLEAALSLGRRGYGVTLADASTELGGHLPALCRLPGLSEWRRVIDHRIYQISQMATVETYLDSPMSAEEVLDFGADHVAIATGSTWIDTGVGRAVSEPIEVDGTIVLTPDDIKAGVMPSGPVVVYDDDHYYMGGVIAELLRARGIDVTLVTPAAEVSHFTHYTLEQHRIQKRLIETGVRIVTNHTVSALGSSAATLACEYTDREHDVPCETAVMVTMRAPIDGLYREVRSLIDRGASGPKSIKRIGDCFAPGTIAAAVYGGHRYARELDAPIPNGVPFRREQVLLQD